MTIKIQFVRSCVVCKDPLSPKCDSCVKHPNRKPRVLEFYDWPKFLEMCKSGHCARVQCQRDGCNKTRWVTINRGRCTSKRLFCGPECANIVVSASRTFKQKVNCAECGKETQKKRYALATWKMSFCNRTCYSIWRAKEKDRTKTQKKLEREGGLQSVACYSTDCKGEIMDHQKIADGRLQCRSCSTCRKENLSTVVGKVPLNVHR